MDWTSVANSFIGALPAVIAAIAGLVLTLRNSARVAQVTNKVDQVTDSQKIIVEKVEEQAGNILKIEKATNSMKDELVKATMDKGLAVGHASGVKDQKAEAADNTINDRAVIAAEKVVNKASEVADKLEKALPGLPVKDDAINVRIINEEEPKKNEP